MLRSKRYGVVLIAETNDRGRAEGPTLTKRLSARRLGKGFFRISYNIATDKIEWIPYFIRRNTVFPIGLRWNPREGSGGCSGNFSRFHPVRWSPKSSDPWLTSLVWSPKHQNSLSASLIRPCHPHSHLKPIEGHEFLFSSQSSMWWFHEDGTFRSWRWFFWFWYSPAETRH